MAAIAACSNGLPEGKRQELQRLDKLLEQNDISVRMSRYLYEKYSGFPDFQRNPSVLLLFPVRFR